MSAETCTPNSNSYTYSCMHMYKQLFNFIFTYMCIYRHVCIYTYTYIHILTHVTCKHFTLTEHFPSFVLSLLWYLKYLAEDEGITSISPVLTEKKPTIPKAYLEYFSVYICMYLSIYLSLIKEHKTFSLHPVLLELSSTTWKWRFQMSQARVNKTFCIVSRIRPPFLPQHSP